MLSGEDTEGVMCGRIICFKKTGLLETWSKVEICCVIRFLLERSDVCHADAHTRENRRIERLTSPKSQKLRWVLPIFSTTTWNIKKCAHAGCPVTSQTITRLFLCGPPSCIWLVPPITSSCLCSSLLQGMKSRLVARHPKPKIKIYIMETPIISPSKAVQSNAISK